MINMLRLIKKTTLIKILLIVFFFYPFSTFAQNYNVTFANTPSVTFQNNGGGGDISSFVSGTLNLESMGNIGIANVMVGVKFSAQTISANYSGPFDVVFQGSNDPAQSDFVGGGYFGGQVGSQNFNAGQTYYVLFKVQPSSMISNFPGDSEILTVVVPGDGVDVDPQDGGVDVDPGNNQDPLDTFNQTLNDYNFNSIDNPLGEEFSVIDFLQQLFANLVKIAIPILVVFFIYSGFRFVEAQGNEEKLSAAKQNFLYVVVGALLVFGAWTIAMVLKGTVEQLEEPITFIIKEIINLV